ncbi:DUF6777 domain-containing protein [Streptomyces sp. TRM70350]|uniref:DUF6777 domain-containing protein n=1 Tax=Streptomyces sp. TRM70350 TaxID=2856165 RepID=UPI001C482367|nr:DUF6777 domain-containing protein [Streptomyces sp. TRM70350]MBV7697861.1 hypothetical protein [Streptomyces sp. TRM70350]
MGLTVFFTRPIGGPAQAGEVILQPANATGPDPYTESTANTTSSLPAATPSAPPSKANAIRSVTGSEPGLYGGSHNTASCDVEKQVRYLTADRAKTKAFASVLDIRESAVPGYLRSLTPLQLRSDTRVTNHGYRDGASTSYQAVLQAGTAVLVDGYGAPKMRCACGNPLGRAIAQEGTPQQKGTAWSGYRPQNVVVVNRAPTKVKEFVIFDAEERDWVRRYPGDHGARDEKTAPPPRHWPLPPTQSPATESPHTEPGKGDRESKTDKDPKPKPDDSPTPKPTTTKPPTEDTPKPTTDTPKPTTDTPKPTTETPKPTTDTPKPTTDTPKPTTDTPKPTTDTPKPTTDTPKPTTDDTPQPNPDTDTPQPPTDDTPQPNPDTDTPQPPTDNSPQPDPDNNAPQPQPDNGNGNGNGNGNPEPNPDNGNDNPAE